MALFIKDKNVLINLEWVGKVWLEIEKDNNSKAGSVYLEGINSSNHTPSHRIFFEDARDAKRLHQTIVSTLIDRDILIDINMRS